MAKKLPAFEVSLGNLVVGFDPAREGSERHAVVVARRTPRGHLVLVDVDAVNPYVAGIARVKTP